MVEQKKTEAPAPSAPKAEEGIFGGVAYHNNPVKSEVAHDGRKDSDKK